MNTQINVRLDDGVLEASRKYAEEHGYSNVQELIKESLREKVFDEDLVTKEELDLILKVLKATEEKGSWRSKKEIFEALER